MKILFLITGPHSYFMLSEQSKKILDNVCSENERNVTYSSRMVPFKKRCGVKNKNIINMDNKCHCSEANNRGVGKYELIIVIRVVEYNLF